MHGELFFDGACSGNPGFGGGGFSLHLEGEKVAEGGVFINNPNCTNNIAEYHGLLEGLKQARSLVSPSHSLSLGVYGDSEVVINQVISLHNLLSFHRFCGHINIYAA
jgi:ribonuclease H / adenosylcobalamin/alpha-ribazole phosphatase